MIKVVLLDFGGVLFPSLWREKLPSGEERDRLKNPVTEILEQNWQEIASGKFGRQQLKKALLQVNNHAFGETELILDSLFTINRGVLEIVRKLRQRGIKVYSFNNDRPLWTDFRRILFSLDKVFCGYFVSCGIGYEKPSPESVQHVLRTLKVSSKECLVIDDRKSNIEALSKYGFEVHHFKNVGRLEYELRRIKLID